MKGAGRGCCQNSLAAIAPAVEYMDAVMFVELTTDLEYELLLYFDLKVAGRIKRKIVLTRKYQYHLQQWEYFLLAART
jgi:hypothetical protein